MKKARELNSCGPLVESADASKACLGIREGGRRKPRLGVKLLKSVWPGHDQENMYGR